MNKNSMRDVIMYYAHDKLGYTAPELSRIFGIGAPAIRRVISKVRAVEDGKLSHGPTMEALKLLKRRYPVRQLESIKLLYNFAEKLNKEINRFMSGIIAYSPEVQDTDFLDGIYCISDNLEYWQDELKAEVENFIHSALAD